MEIDRKRKKREEKMEAKNRRKTRAMEGGRPMSLMRYLRFMHMTGIKEEDAKLSKWEKFRKAMARDAFVGSLFYNLLAFLLPALHSTLSPLLVGKIDTSEVATTNVYTYIMAMGLILNDGLPQAAWTVIGDQDTRSMLSRISLTKTLILFQAICGLLISGVVMSNARASVVTTSDNLQNASLIYVRLTSISGFSSAIEVSVSNCARALDHPEIPVAMNAIKFILNIIMDITIMSQFHTGLQKPSMNHQAAIQLACNLTSATAGLFYLYWVTKKKVSKSEDAEKSKARPCVASLHLLWKHGIWTLSESAVRNVSYLWLMNGLDGGMGPDDTLAWLTFNAIRGRGSILMFPLQALEASTLRYVGLLWGEWRQEDQKVDRPARKDMAPEESKQIEKDIAKKVQHVTRPAWLPILLAPLIEIPVYIIFSIWGARSFASYLSESAPVTAMVQWMWRTIDWCYILSPVTTLLCAILIATTPRFFLLQGAITNVLWIMPWAIAVPGENLTANSAWHALATIFSVQQIFGLGSAAFSIWLWRKLLMKGKVKLLPVTEEVDVAPSVRPNKPPKDVFADHTSGARLSSDADYSKKEPGTFRNSMTGDSNDEFANDGKGWVPPENKNNATHTVKTAANDLGTQGNDFEEDGALGGGRIDGPAAQFYEEKLTPQHGESATGGTPDATQLDGKDDLVRSKKNPGTPAGADVGTRQEGQVSFGDESSDGSPANANPDTNNFPDTNPAPGWGDNTGGGWGGNAGGGHIADDDEYADG